MWTGLAASSRLAPQDSAVFLALTDVDGAEGVCGEGSEAVVVRGDGGGIPLPPLSPAWMSW